MRKGSEAGMDQEERNKHKRKKGAGPLWAKRVFASIVSISPCLNALLSSIPHLFPFISSFSLIQSFHLATLSNASFDNTMSCPAEGYLNRVIKGTQEGRSSSWTPSFFPFNNIDQCTASDHRIQSDVSAAHLSSSPSAPLAVESAPA